MKKVLLAAAFALAASTVAEAGHRHHGHHHGGHYRHYGHHGWHGGGGWALPAVIGAGIVGAGIYEYNRGPTVVYANPQPPTVVYANPQPQPNVVVIGSGNPSMDRQACLESGACTYTPAR